MSNFFNGGSGQSNPFSTGGSTANTIPKESSIAGQLVDSSLVDDGAGNVTIPGKIANTGQIVISQLATPSAPTLVITGGVGTSYSYKVVAKVGTAVTAASAAGSTVVGPTTLDGTHFIDVNWTAVVGATSYDIYRTVGGAAQGKIGNVLAPLLTLRDNALVGDATTAPIVNTTGGLTSASLTEVPGSSVTSTQPIVVPDIPSGAGTPSVRGATAASGLYLNGSNVGLVSTTAGWAAANSTAASYFQVPSGGGFGISSSGTIAAAGNDIGFGRFAIGVGVMSSGTIAGNTVTPATVKSLWAKLGVGGGTTPVALTGQTAAITTTAILTGTANTAGVYRVSYTANTTTSGTGTTATISILWNDGNAKTFTSGTFALNAVDATGQVNGSQVVRLAASQNISYSVAGTFGTSAYSLYVSIEQLQ